MSNIPVVEPVLAVHLAEVIRQGILKIAKLRLTNVNADEKAAELFAYVISDEFQTRFRSMADAVASLKGLQDSERTWHEKQWVKQSRFHVQIESRQREIDAKLQLIAKEGTGERLRPVTADRFRIRDTSMTRIAGGNAND